MGSVDGLIVVSIFSIEGLSVFSKGSVDELLGVSMV